jgi:hypothetical protein
VSPRHHGRSRRVVRLLLRRRWLGIGTLPVIVCPLCGCLLVEHAVEQHDRIHALGLNGDRP